MPAKTAARTQPAKTTKRAKSAKPAAPAKPTKAAKPAKTAPARLGLNEVMAALEAAGSEQTRKTYARHGVAIPMFGVSFATLKTLYQRIKLDHELALALWDTGNFDARNLAVKVVDPSRMTPADLDRWSRDPTAAMCSSYVAHVTAEGPHAPACAAAWLKSSDANQHAMGWKLVGALAMVDASLDDAWFRPHLATIERDIHRVSNAIRSAMNLTLISIGCRSPGLRDAATAAAARIGKVHVDHGDTACKTPDAGPDIRKAWDYATSKQAASPAAQERARASMRIRC
jgi:3-methyladenine DNA glycosylase AlkD